MQNEGDKRMSVFGKAKKEFIIIVGCGRFGAALAADLSEQDENVVIIDLNPIEFRKLPLSYGGLSIPGDGTDLDLLTTVSAKDASIFIAATNNDDTNIMAAQIAKQFFRIEKVIVRIHDQSKQVAYEDCDIESICPATLSVREFSRLTNQDIEV